MLRVESGLATTTERERIYARPGQPKGDRPVTGFDSLPDEDKRAVEGAMDKLADPAAMDRDGDLIGVHHANFRATGGFGQAVPTWRIARAIVESGCAFDAL